MINGEKNWIQPLNTVGNNMLFVDVFVYWLFNQFFPPEKPKAVKRRNDIYDTSSLLVADSMIRNDDGCPKTFKNSDVDNSDPFLNEEYHDGVDW